MSDEADVWAGLKVRSQIKRSQNRMGSAELLRRAGIEFDSHNMGAHLVVKHAGKVVDFWPGTGKWCVRGGLVQNRGVNGLMSWCKKQIS